MTSLRNLIVLFMDFYYQQTTWDEHLNEFHLAYNSSIHSATKYSPFSIVHGREARTLATPDLEVKTITTQEYKQQVRQFLGPALSLVQLEINRTQAKNAIDFKNHHSIPNFAVGDLVLVDFPPQSSAGGKQSGKLVRSFLGPFQVVKLLSSDRYNLLDLETKKDWSNIQ